MDVSVYVLFSSPVAVTNSRHFADDIFNPIFVNENIWIPIKISLKFVPKGSSNNIPALVQIMAWRRPGDKPLFEPVVVSLLTHIWVTQPQWVNGCVCLCFIFFSSYHSEAQTNGRHFADDIFKLIFVKENLCLWIQISLKLVAKDLIDKL